MKLNERIMRFLGWPVKHGERLRDWLEQGMRAASNDGDREAAPLERRCYLMSETHLSGCRLIIGFESLDDCHNAHDFLLRHYPQRKLPEVKP